MAHLSTEILLVSEDLVLGRGGNLSIVIWRRKPTGAGAAALEQHYRSMMSRFPQGFASLIVIEDGTPTPDDHLRRQITATMDAPGERLSHVAVVLESKGFAAAALRAALASMSMVTRSRFPRRFVGSVDEAVSWMASGVRDDLGRELSVSAILRGVADLRHAVRGREGR